MVDLSTNRFSRFPLTVELQGTPLFVNMYKMRVVFLLFLFMNLSERISNAMFVFCAYFLIILLQFYLSLSCQFKTQIATNVTGIKLFCAFEFFTSINKNISIIRQTELALFLVDLLVEDFFQPYFSITLVISFQMKSASGQYSKL